MDEDYDVVIDTLQKQRDILWKMTKSNMNADMFNIMDEIRLEQIDQLEKAITLWKDNKTKCYCYNCADTKTRMSTMILCPKCGNKRCPKATDHHNECTNSNDVGQEGSRY